MEILGLWLVKRKVGNVVSAVGNAVNPASDTNLINRGVTAGVQVITGDENQTLGGSIFDAWEVVRCNIIGEKDGACDQFHDRERLRRQSETNQNVIALQ